MARLLCFDGFNLKHVECNGLNDYYRHLECDCFDIAQRKIGDKYYDIFVDDIGLFKDDPRVTALTEDGEPMLVGNLIFANHDNQGNTTSLTDEDIDNIMNHVGFAVMQKHDIKELIKVVICDY